MVVHNFFWCSLGSQICCADPSNESGIFGRAERISAMREALEFSILSATELWLSELHQARLKTNFSGARLVIRCAQKAKTLRLC